MSLPKRRHSRARGRKRRGGGKATPLPTLTSCAECGAPIEPHTACKKCGAFRGVRQVIRAKAQ